MIKGSDIKWLKAKINNFLRDYKTLILAGGLVTELPENIVISRLRINDILGKLSKGTTCIDDLKWLKSKMEEVFRDYEDLVLLYKIANKLPENVVQTITRIHNILDKLI